MTGFLRSRFCPTRRQYFAMYTVAMMQCVSTTNCSCTSFRPGSVSVTHFEEKHVKPSLGWSASIPAGRRYPLFHYSTRPNLPVFLISPLHLSPHLPINIVCHPINRHSLLLRTPLLLKYSSTMLAVSSAYPIEAWYPAGPIYEASRQIS